MAIPGGDELVGHAGVVGLLRIERRPGYRLWVGGPVPPGAGAWTLGSLVIVRRRHAHRRLLLAHELEHVQQWRDQGVARFVRSYLGAYGHQRLRGYPHGAAYRRIPAEISAEWRARRNLGIGCG
ncbi:hypothetical protein BH23ACT2_BH23ACT2_24560 [soil metagenome]